MRESIADYDFRSWMDLQLPMAHRGAIWNRVHNDRDCREGGDRSGLNRAINALEYV